MSFFRAVAAATQSLPNVTETEVVFGTVVSDPDSGFSSNRFTVPAGWNGKIGALSAGLVGGSHNPNQIRIQRSTDSGSSWTTIAEGGLAPRSAGTVTAAPVLFATGDIYRIAYYGAANTKLNQINNFFSGWVYPTSPTKLGMFRGQMVSDVSMSANGDRLCPWDDEIVDSHSFHVSGSGHLIVPSDFNGGFLHLCGGFHALADPPTLRLWRSTDSGGSWTNIAEYTTPVNTIDGSLDAGAIAAVTGEYFRLTARVTGSNFTLSAVPQSFMSALFFKY